jgi:hypothetical protein
MPKKGTSLHFLAEELLDSIGLSSKDVLQSNQWVFDDALKKSSSKQLSSALLDIPYLQVKYHVLCATLVKHANHYDQDKQKEHIESILVFAQVLEHLQLQSTQLELKSLQRTQAFCRNYLQKIGLDITQPNTQKKHKGITDPHEEIIRSQTTQADFWRLIVLRGRRVLFWSVPLINNFEYYGRFVTPLDAVLRTLVFYQACVLVPRFLTNLLHLFKHWWSPTKHEQSLSSLERHQVHLNMNARWWEITYDFGWITAGLINAFVLTGPLAAFAIYAAVALPSYNLLLHTIRLFIEDGRLKKLMNTYKKQLAESPSNKEELTAFLEQLEQRREYNQKALLLRICVCISIISTGFFVVFANSMPLILPFIAAIISVLATIAGKAIPPYLPKQKDQLKELELDDSPSPLLRNSLFLHKTASQKELDELVGSVPIQDSPCI